MEQGMDECVREQPHVQTIRLARANDEKHAYLAGEILESTDDDLDRLAKCRLLQLMVLQSDNVSQALEERVKEVEADIQAGRKDTGQRTVFYEILTNDDICAEEKESKHLKALAQVLVAAVFTLAFAIVRLESYHY